MIPMTFDGGPADMRRSLRDDLPEEIVEGGETYRLARDGRGEPLHSPWAGYRYRWVWPEVVPSPDAARPHGTDSIPDRRRGTPGAYAWER